MNERKEDKIGHWIRRFLQEYMVTVRNCSQKTRQSYRDAYRMLLVYASGLCGKDADELLVEDLSQSMVLSFLDHLERDRKCQAQTRNVRLAAIMSLAKYISLQSPEHVGWCGSLRAIPFKKTARRQIPYFERNEIDAMIFAPDQSDAQGFRDHVLLRFLYNTGARADEVARLTVGDIHFGVRKSDPSVVDIIGKGRKQRQCPLWKITVDELRTMIGGRADDTPLFVNRLGDPITRYGIYELVVKYAKAASERVPSIMRKRPSPHTIRHTTATHLVQAGVDVNTVRAWLGHSSVETTNIYVEISMDAKIKAIEQCAPIRGRKRSRRWRDDEKLMAFLDAI